MKFGRKTSEHNNLNYLNSQCNGLCINVVSLLKQTNMDRILIFWKRQGAWVLFATMLFLFSTLQVSAQHAESLNVILSGQSDENQELNSLFSDVHPSAYAENGELKIYGGSSPVVVYAAPESFSLLTSDNEAFNSVKLLKVTVSGPEQLASSLNLGQLESFEALEYVVVVFGYDACGNDGEQCLAGLIQNLVTNPGELPVYYHLSIPE